MKIITNIFLLIQKMTTQCDSSSLKPFNNNNACIACNSLFPNCRECDQTEPTKTICKVCKVPFTGLSCERNCEQGFIQLNQSNCQPFTAAFPADQTPDYICTGAKYGKLNPPDQNGDTTCTCTKDNQNDSKPARHFTGPNCDRRKQGINCNGLMPVCSGCNGKTCKSCPPGTTSQDPNQGCCNNGCATCLTTSGAIYDIEPFPPSVCLTCDPDSIRPVLKDSNCISCADAINGCLSCSQIDQQDPECIKCRGRLTGPNCEIECEIDQIQYNINFCQSSSCTNDTQCNGNGSCQLINENFKCVCNNSFQGENCTETSFACSVSHCKTCSTPDACQVCEEQFTLADGKCVAGTCQEIFPNCEICTGAVPSLACSKCAGNFTGSVCDVLCENQYVQYEIGKCQNASCETATACSGYGVCQLTEMGDRECVCEEGKSGLNCENNCDSSCLTCGVVVSECVSCRAGLFLLGNKCVECSEVPNCNNCSQENPTAAIKCQSCQGKYKGVSCDRQCPDGQVQFNVNYCQATSCVEGGVVCGENGICKLSKDNFLCDCIPGVEGSNCETTTTGLACGGGPEIKKCVQCLGGSQQCQMCFKGAAVSEDKLACCEAGCHSCTSEKPSECIGCDKTSDKPYYQNSVCQSCKEIYPNCQSCRQTGFFTKVHCLQCEIGFTGETCQKKCQTGFVKFGTDGCQPASCDTHLQCSGEGTCEQSGVDLSCVCLPGVTGNNCEHRPPCSVANCELCSISSSQICNKCQKNYTISNEKCEKITCDEAISNCNIGCQGQPGNYTCQTCKTPFTGNQCDISCGEGYLQLNQAHCQAVTCSGSVECNGHGQCGDLESGHKKCVCDEFFSGPNCENNCSEPCKTCDNADKSVCISCYGQDVIQNKTCTNCEKLFPNCQTCSTNGPLTCTTCKTQFVTADCSTFCEIGTIPYNDIGCQPESCITPDPCNGHSECVPSGNNLSCKCSKDSTGPNCEIQKGNGKTCDGKYKIAKCVLCSGGSPNVCALCAKNTVMNTPHTECCDQHCADCEMGSPSVCTECSGRMRPYLVDGKCVSCATIPKCEKCYQATPKSPLQCDKCVSTFTGLQCEKDCGKGRKQYNSSDCQSSSCTFPNQCDGNGICSASYGNRYCQCKPGFSGENCENQLCKVENCQSCTFNDPETCKLCFNHLTEASNCKECRQGYYQTGIECVQCGEFCTNCDRNGCVDCFDDKINIDGECKDEVKAPSNKLSTGGIIGIVIAVLLILAVAIIVTIVVMKRRKGGSQHVTKDRQIAISSNSDNQNY